MDLCSVTDPDAKSALERAFLKARVSYFLRWEKPTLFEKIFKGEKTRIVFCINSAQLTTAEEVLGGLEDMEGKVRIIKSKSHNSVNIM
jgi:hypothetical protein